MKGRNLADNLYRSRIMSIIQPIGLSGSPLDEFEIMCDTPPRYDSGRVFVDFDSDDKNKRDLIFFHRKRGNTIFYYRKNRDLLNNGSKNVRHEEGATIQMNDVSEWINSLSKNVDDLGYITYPHTDSLTVFVHGGKMDTLNGGVLITDTVIKLPDDTENAIVIDREDNGFKAVKLSDFENGDKNISRLIAKVTTSGGKIVSLVDERAAVLGNSLSKDAFDLKDGLIVIKDGYITIDKIANDMMEIVDRSHSHSNMSALESFVDSDGELLWRGQNLFSRGEINSGENIGTGAEIYKDKNGNNLRFKKVTGAGGITVVDKGDSLEIVGGMVTEAHTDTFVGDGAKTTYQLSKEAYVPSMSWVVTEAGNHLVNTVDYSFSEDRRQISFVVAPINKVFVTYITRSELGFQTSGEANYGENIGNIGAPVYNKKTGDALQFNRIVAGDNIIVSQGPNGEIIISGKTDGNSGQLIDSFVGVPEGEVDGTRNTFLLPQIPINKNAVAVFRNGILQTMLLDYDIDSNAIRFYSPPAPGTKLSYEMYGAGSYLFDRVIMLSPISTNSSSWKDREIKELTHTPAPGSVRVWVKGLFLIEGEDFDIIGKKIYIKDVAKDDRINIIYLYK